MYQVKYIREVKYARRSYQIRATGSNRLRRRFQLLLFLARSVQMVSGQDGTKSGEAWGDSRAAVGRNSSEVLRPWGNSYLDREREREQEGWHAEPHRCRRSCTGTVRKCARCGQCVGTVRASQASARECCSARPVPPMQAARPRTLAAHLRFNTPPRYIRSVPSAFHQLPPFRRLRGGRLFTFSKLERRRGFIHNPLAPRP